MKTKAVIDRFEGDKAVVLVGDEQDALIIPIIPKTLLPKGTKEGDWLQVEVKDDRIISAKLDEETTAAAKKRISDKLEKLRRGEHRK